MKLKPGGLYYFQNETTTIFFQMIKYNNIDKDFGTYNFSSFIFLQQSEDENLDGWAGIHNHQFDDTDMKTCDPIESGFDWLASNDFYPGTPQQQLIAACFEQIY